MGNTYITKREAKAMENRIMSAMDSKFNEILEVLKTNQQSADEVSEEKVEEKVEKKSEKKTREERLTEAFGDIDSRRKFVEYQNKIRAEFSKCYEESKKTMVISPKSKYCKVVDTLANEFKTGEKKWSVKICKETFKANAKKIEK